MTDSPDWPAGVARPAARALANAGVERIEDLARWRREDLAALHGMGPKALGALEAALLARDLSFRDG